MLYWNNDDGALRSDDIAFLLHLTGVYTCTIYLVCMLNTLFAPSSTPFNGVVNVKMHVIMDRADMIAGHVKCMLGAYLACGRACLLGI